MLIVVLEATEPIAAVSLFYHAVENRENILETMGSRRHRTFSPRCRRVDGTSPRKTALR
jgi:hypothetical protein